MRSLVVTNDEGQAKHLQKGLGEKGVVITSGKNFSMDMVQENRPHAVVLDTSTVDISENDQLMELLGSERAPVIFWEFSFKGKKRTETEQQLKKLIQAVSDIVDPDILDELRAAPSPDKASREDSAREGLWVVGASSGGPQAISRLLSSIKAKPSKPIVVVQHHEESGFDIVVSYIKRTAPADWRIKIMREGDAFSDAEVFFVPASGCPSIEGGDSFSLKPTLKSSPFRPNIDQAINALGKTSPDGINIVILSGMGSDGKRGLSSWGGRAKSVLVQKPETAAMPSMPKAAIEAFDRAVVGELEDLAHLMHWTL